MVRRELVIAALCVCCGCSAEGGDPVDDGSDSTPHRTADGGTAGRGGGSAGAGGVKSGSGGAKPASGGTKSGGTGGESGTGGSSSAGGSAPCGPECPNPGVATLEHFENLPLLRLDTHALSFSSTDPKLQNNDQGNYLYADGSDEVIFDSQEPGVIYRWWHTGDNMAGEYRLYFDGEQTPRLTFQQFPFWLATIAPFVPPLSLDDGHSSGGFVTYYPIAYGKSLKITAVGFKQRDYFNVNYTRYVERAVPTFTGTESLDRVISIFNGAGSSPIDASPSDVKSTGKVTLAAGATTVLATLAGPAQIVGLTLTLPNSGSGPLGAFGSSRLQVFWDGEATPSVDAPVGEFYGLTTTQNATVRAIPVGHIDDRFYCYFPMPYANSAKIQLVNGAGSAVADVGFEIVSRPMATDFKQLGYFHVVRNSVASTTSGKDYTILSVQGSGHYVGTNVLFPSGGDTLEGNDRTFIDGSRSPAINGTGTEDYFNGGWYFSKGPFSAPTHGAPTLTDGFSPNSFNAYRFLLGDVVPFASSIAVKLQHGQTDNKSVPYASLAYFYLNPKVRSTPSDKLDLGDAASIAQHAYAAPNAQSVSVSSRFMSDDATAYAYTGRTLTGPSSFTLKVDGQNRGVTLRRLLDQSVGKQQAQVAVDNVAVGTWKTSETNSTFRWREDDFWIPSSATQGKTEIKVTITPAGPYSEFRYEAYALLPP